MGKVQITFRGGAQIVVCVSDLQWDKESGGKFTRLTWTSAGTTQRLEALDIAEVIAIVTLESDDT